MRHNTLYTIIFAALICVVCGVFVSYAAVSLNDRQELNAAIDNQTIADKIIPRRREANDLRCQRDTTSRSAIV